jgi:hypothetical protein
MMGPVWRGDVGGSVDEDPDLEQSREIVNTPSPLAGDDPHKLEYIKAMLELVREDIRHVMLLVTAAFAISALFVTQIPLEAIVALPRWSRALLVVGLLAMVLAGLFFFRYVRCLHMTQMAIVRCLPSLDTVKTRELWAGRAGIWARHGVEYQRGRTCFAAGTLLLAVVLVHIYVFPPA